MATLIPPPSKRQRREDLERSKVQQDVAEQLPQDIGSFKARFIDGDGNQMTDVIEIPLASATEKMCRCYLTLYLGGYVFFFFLVVVAVVSVISFHRPAHTDILASRTEKILLRIDFGYISQTSQTR